MPMSESLDRLELSNQRLIEAVAEMTRQLRISKSVAAEAKDAAHRARILARWFAGISVVALISSGLAIYSIYTTCQNANTSRAANLAIWEVVLGANQKEATPKQRQQAKVFDAYVRQVYRPHDCRNLFKPYPLPPAPDLSSS